MKITDIKVFPVREEKLKAFVSIIFDDCFMINDIKVIRGKDGFFISMPSRRKRNGKFKDIAHPLNNETRQAMEKEILAAYEKHLEDAPEAAVDAPEAPRRKRRRRRGRRRGADRGAERPAEPGSAPQSAGQAQAPAASTAPPPANAPAGPDAAPAAASASIASAGPAAAATSDSGASPASPPASGSVESPPSAPASSSDPGDSERSSAPSTDRAAEDARGDASAAGREPAPPARDQKADSKPEDEADHDKKSAEEVAELHLRDSFWGT